MMDRILVAVDDSRPALAAADYAIRLALTNTAELHFVTVAEPGREVDGITSYVSGRAEAAGLTSVATTLHGQHPFEAVLTFADEWGADLIIMGRSDLRRPGRPYVGSQTEHLLEFTHLPVLVVPDP
jgi:nucleotide-binding universal stress UspA family protein